MNKIKKFINLLIIVIVIAMLFPSQVSAASPEDDRTIFGSNYTLESGRILDGNLNVIGGVVDIEEDATVNGDMFVLGGLLTINGTIQGNLVVIGGTVTLEENAVIEGDLVSPASYINRHADAVVEGNQVESWDVWNEYNPPRFFRSGPFHPSNMDITRTITWIGKAAALGLILLGLAALMLLIIPNATHTMTQSLNAKPWAVLGFGALTALVMAVGGLFLTITICFIPVVILAGLAFSLAVLAGWLALGFELGKRIASGIFKGEWHPVLAAVIGNLVLYLFARGLDLIPCLGGFLVFIALLFGLGMAVVTFFGSRPYPRTPDEEVEAEMVILEPGEASEEAELLFAEKPGQQVIKAVHPIEELELGSRATNNLKGAGVNTVEDVLTLLKEGDAFILKIDGIGAKSLKDLKQALKKKGYPLPKQ